MAMLTRSCLRRVSTLSRTEATMLDITVSQWYLTNPVNPSTRWRPDTRTSSSLVIFSRYFLFRWFNNQPQILGSSNVSTWQWLQTLPWAHCLQINLAHFAHLLIFPILSTLDLQSQISHLSVLLEILDLPSVSLKSRSPTLTDLKYEKLFKRVDYNWKVLMKYRTEKCFDMNSHAKKSIP